jgi:hypothetical protein
MGAQYSKGGAHTFQAGWQLNRRAFSYTMHGTMPNSGEANVHVCSPSPENSQTIVNSTQVKVFTQTDVVQTDKHHK